MRILIGWDDPEGADLLSLYLGSGENEVAISTNKDELFDKARRELWDVLLLSLTYPTAVDGFNTFDTFQKDYPETPVVLACRQREMYDLLRFFKRGVRQYIIRDDAGDYMFLLLACLESAVEAVRAEEARRVALKLREEVDSVRKLQESIIPTGLIPPAGYTIEARYEPAEVAVGAGQSIVMAGGDYYDLFCPDDRTLIVILGDAAGHGLRACMSIMTMHTLVRMFKGDQYRNTSALVAEVNNRLCENSIVQSGGGFITLYYAAIDTETNIMTWSSAGHPPALIQNRLTNEIVQVGSDDEGGLPLGISPGMEYSAGTVQLPPSSRLLIYTDGLTDAFPLGGEKMRVFGTQGIHTALRDSVSMKTADALAHLFNASHDFTEGNGRHDDTSVVLVDR